MSTTYQAPMVAYDGHAMHGYPAGRTKMAMTDPDAQLYRHSSQQPQQPQLSQPPQHQLASNWPPREEAYATAASLPSHPQQMVRQPSPASSTNLAAISGSTAAVSTGTVANGDPETLICHSLEIPRCISPNGGNLADFAAQMTCLFWFESADELKQAESIRTRPINAPIVRLPPLARPLETFRKWVLSVLSTTQVTQNVILLALLFIYRLKMSSPKVKGRAGSEYRLLVVALMLGNKFLDDNTYTNKTWAEVSSFPVKEIHVMEVEFLSNMRYNLLASKDQWDGWLEKMSCFHEYYERALRLPESPVCIPSPTHNMANSPLVSPTITNPPPMHELGPTTPTASNNFSPTSARSYNWPGYQPNPLSPLAAKPSMVLPPSRKRSFEEDQSEHPAKRLVPLTRMHPTAASMASQQPSAQLSAPQLNIVTNQQQPVSLPQPIQYTQPNANYMPPATGGPVANHVSLPPLQPGTRAMTTVYQQQPGPASIPQQHAPPTSTPAPAVHSNAFAPTLPSHTPMGFGSAGKNRSPGSLAPYASSPMPDQFGGAPGIHTPMSHTPIANSPSFYLQQRNSPYKPIRHVNTLLYPPPSASLDQYHLSVPIPPTQMHYQPLGRRNDVRTGVVPEFLVYNRAQHPQMHPHGAPQGHYPA